MRMRDATIFVHVPPSPNPGLSAVVEGLSAGSHSTDSMTFIAGGETTVGMDPETFSVTSRRAGTTIATSLPLINTPRWPLGRRKSGAGSAVAVLWGLGSPWRLGELR